MSLQGSLDTFALPDVLVLLASTKKTGELRVEGAGIDGRIWVDKGDVVGGVAGRSVRPVDVLFELLRLTDGDFVFDHATEPRRDSAPVSAEALLAEAQECLGEWRSIEAVVPSMAARVSLARTVPGDEVTLSAADWRVVVAVAHGSTVDEVATTLEAGEFDACKQLKVLIEQGLVEIEDEGAATSAAPRGEASAEPAKPRRTRKAADAGAKDPALSLARAALAEVAADEPAEPAAASTPAAEASAGDLVSQLQAIGAENEPTPDADVADAVAAAPAISEVPADQASAQDDVESDEEGIDRGLLLKFLSSVRS